MHTKHRTLPRNIFLRAVMIAGLALAVAFAVSPARAFADDAPVTEGVPYRIVSFSNPSLVAQFDAAAPAVGEAATCAVPNGTSGQVFTFAKTASGAYYIRSYHNPSLLLTPDSLATGGTVSARHIDPAKTQTWTIEPQADGTFFIVAEGTGMMLDTTGDPTHVGSKCVMWGEDGTLTQKWTFEEVSPSAISGAYQLPDSSDGTAYRLVNVANPAVAASATSDSPASGSAVQVAAKTDGASRQTFLFTPQANGTFQVKSAVADLVLTASSLTWRGAMTLAPADGSLSQSWILQKVSGGWRLVCAAKSSLMLDVNGQYPQDGAACILWGEDGGNIQKWTIEAAGTADPGAGTEPGGNEPGGDPDPGTGTGGDPDPDPDPDPGTGTDPEPDGLPVSGSAYMLSNLSNASVVVQAPSATPVAGEQAVMGFPRNGANQVVVFERQDDGSYIIRSFAEGGLVLTAQTLDWRGAVAFEAPTGAATQRWTLEKLSDGSFHIISCAKTTLMLDTNGSTTASGAAVILWGSNGTATQKWRFTQVDTASISQGLPYVGPNFPNSEDGTVYRIVSVSNPRTVLQLDLSAGSARNATIGAKGSTEDMLFRMELQPDHTYLIRSVALPNLLLTPGSVANYGDIFGMNEGYGATQKWILEEVSNGVFIMRCEAKTNLLVDTSGATTQVGARVLLYVEEGSNTQRWTFEAVEYSGGSGTEPGTEPGDEPGDDPTPEGYPKADTPYRLSNLSNPAVVAQAPSAAPVAGQQLNMAAPGNGANQVVLFDRQDDGSYIIKSYANTGLVLTAETLDWRGAVAFDTAAGTDAQRWTLEKLSDGSFHFVSCAKPTIMLDTNGQTTRAGAAVILWGGDGGNTQKWRFTEVDPTTIVGGQTGGDEPDPGDEPGGDEPTSDGFPVSGSLYMLSNRSNPAVVVQSPSAFLVEGNQANMGAPGNRANQVFSFIRQADGTYIIRSCVDEGLVLTAKSLTWRGAVTLEKADGTDAQRWRLEKLDDGTFRIISCANASLVLDTNGQATQAGAAVILWGSEGSNTQKWTFAKVEPEDVVMADPTGFPTAGKAYRLSNLSNPAVVAQAPSELPVAGEQLNMAAPGNGANQVVVFERQPGGTYLIRSYANSSLVLTAESLEWRGAVAFDTENGSDAQRWKLEKLSDGTFHIISCAKPTIMLDTNGSATVAGAAVILWGGEGSNTQKWRLTEVDTSTIVGGGLGGDGPDPGDEPGGDPDPGDDPTPEGFPTSGAAFRISNLSNPAVVVQAPTDVPRAGDQANMASPDHITNQVFVLERQPGGTYLIRSYADENLVLTAKSLTWRGAVTLEAPDGSASQLWTLELLDDGSFHVISCADSSLMLDTNGQTTAAGAAVILWGGNNTLTQKWTFAEVDPATVFPPDPDGFPTSGNTYRLSNLSNPALVLESPAETPIAGEQCDMVSPGSGANQVVIFERQADGTYLIRSYADQTMLLTAKSLSWRGAVTFDAADGSNKQRWSLEKLSDGSFHVVSCADSSLMLDTNGSSTVSGAAVILWGGNSTSTQKWAFTEVDPATISAPAPASGVWDGKYYRIVSVSNPALVMQLGLSVAEDGSYCNVGYIRASLDQVFTRETLEDGTVYIRSASMPRLVLTAKAFTMRAGVGCFPVSSDREQRWTIESSSAPGAVRVIAAGNTSFMLDTTGSSTQPNAACIMWSRDSGTTQQWKFVEVDIDNLEAGTTAPSTGGPVYQYQEMYDISVVDMIRYQKTNNWYNSSTQANDLVYAVNPANFKPGDARFYQFLKLDGGYSGVTAEELDAFIASTSSGRSGKLAGMGYAFVMAAQMYGINEVYLLAHAIHESGWGTSTLAKGYYYDGKTTVFGQTWPAGTYYNFYGIGAYDSGPISGGRALAVSEGWDSPEKAILGAAEWIMSHYIRSTSGNGYFAQNTLYEMRWHSAFSNQYFRRSSHQYATGTSWAYRIADIMNQCYTHAGATPEGAVYLIPVYNPSIVWRVADDWHDPDAYVMQWNDEVIYTYDQFDQLTDEELFYGRNEIFYCHGYEFDGVGDNITDADLEAFFRAKTWGQSQEGTAFTQAELANLAVIEQLEADRNSPYATRGYHLCDVP